MPKGKKKAKTSAGATAAPEQRIHTREFTMDVRVGLDPNERDPLVKDLTDKLREQDEIAVEAKNVAKGYADKKAAVKEDIDELAMTLSQGRPTPMLVEELKDFDKGTVTIVRSDTRAVVSKRDMTEEDRQLDLGSQAAEAAGEEDDAPLGDDHDEQDDDDARA